MKKLLASLSVFAFAIVAGLMYQSQLTTVSANDNWGEHDDSDGWRSGPCIQKECGKPEGLKQQYRTVEECTFSCPVVHFVYKEYSNCPNGYKPKGADKCEKEHSPDKGKVIDRPFTSKNYDVKYDKSNDPHKCHRPSDNDLSHEYDMDHNARQAFKNANGEWKDAIKSCTSHQEQRTVACMIHKDRIVPCDPSITPSPTPTPIVGDEDPTPTPTQIVGDPTATPVPGPGKVAALEYAVSCEKDEVKVEMHFTDDGKAMEGVLAKFDYNGKTREATSNSDGWAITMYGKDGENKVTGFADGFNKIEKTVEFPDCPAQTGTGGAVLGATTTKGQVLGATTYAKTGVAGDTLMQLSGVLGTLMISAGALLHAKQK